MLLLIILRNYAAVPCSMKLLHFYLTYVATTLLIETGNVVLPLFDLHCANTIPANPLLAILRGKILQNYL